jgi:hypothetical protein
MLYFELSSLPTLASRYDSYPLTTVSLCLPTILLIFFRFAFLFLGELDCVLKLSIVTMSKDIRNLEKLDVRPCPDVIF